MLLRITETGARLTGQTTILTTDKANEYITALNLRLVYLVSNPRAQTPTTAGFNMASNWTQMTPAQRELYIQQQAQRVLALDPASRLQMLRGLMENMEISPQQALMKSVLSQMTDDERVAHFNSRMTRTAPAGMTSA